MLNHIQAIVLAAGKSTRFNTGNTKLIEKLCGQSMIVYTTRMLQSLTIPTTVVVGYQKELVIETLQKYHDNITFIEQTEQRGTGHALASTKSQWHYDTILVMNGDMPLTTPDIIEQLFKKHIQENAVMSFVSSHNSDPSGSHYGRVIQNGNHLEIIEAKNFKGDLSEHCCINAGIYLFSRSFLEQYVPLLEENPVGKEFYLTDLVRLASEQHLRVATISAPFDRIRGINTFEELWAAEHIKRCELIKYWMGQGVRFSAPQTVHIGLDVFIGRGTKIGSCAHILGTTRIGENCRVKSFSIVKNSTLEDNVIVHPHSIVEGSMLHAGAEVGPFAHININSKLGAHSVIGNFVETKNSTIGDHTKAKHLTYLGNAEIGSHVNIGAGTITCNYDGKEKHQTTIQDNVFIGSNNSLVAPVTIETGAYTAAGSTITHHVPAYALGIGRARQINKPDYMRPQEAPEPAHDNSSSSDKLLFEAARKIDSESITQ